MSDTEFEKWDQECNDINSDKQKLLDQMKANLTKGESAAVLQRLAKVSMLLAKTAEKTNNKEQEKKLATDALTYAEKACKLEPNNAECHKWFCAAVGKLANLSSTKEKIAYGKQFQEHAEVALKINPNDYLMQSMYGQWCYQVASLTWLERKIANAIYGNVPKADYDMALNAFKKSNELNETKESTLWIAKTLIAKKQTAEVKQYVQKGLTLPNKSVADEVAHKELEALSKTYK